MRRGRRAADRDARPARGCASARPGSSLLLALLACSLCGCGSLGYLAHVSAGQLRVLLDRELLTEERIAQLEGEERARLGQLVAARRFGTRLGLAHSDGYRHLLDRTPEQAVRVVVAAPADRLEPVTWWFPLVGRVAYRGYFDPDRAAAFAGRLADKGYDTYVRTAPLYSTLGWFDDPIPRPLLSWPEVDLVSTGLHELLHETVFISGDSDYNEALATFVGQEATLRFYAEDEARGAEARRLFADRRRYATLLEELADELERTYASTGSREEALERRAVVFRRFQQRDFASRGWETSRYLGFAKLELSNAVVVAERTYLGLLDCFSAWLGRLEGDLALFIDLQKKRPGELPEDLAECAE